MKAWVMGILGLSVIAMPGASAAGAITDSEASRESLSGRPCSGLGPNLALPTLGGRQWWADVCWDGGWRIQRHAWTGHYRLLDPNNTRRGWGTRDGCRQLMAQECKDSKRSSDHLVVLLHGLGRSFRSMKVLERGLNRQGFHTAALSYPSTRRSIESHASTIAGLLGELEGVKRVSFVTHSLGSLVVRQLCSEHFSWRERVSLERVVMIAPPNQGAFLAETVGSWAPVRWLLGDAIDGILHAKQLPVPDVEFGIVVGARGDEDGWNPWILGDDDGVVGVDETTLEGAKDRIRVVGVHSLMLRDSKVIQATAEFLRSGSFHEWEKSAL